MSPMVLRWRCLVIASGRVLSEPIQTSLGGRVTIAGVVYTIVGVAAEQFESPNDLWTPLRPSTSGEGQGINYTIIGRVGGGIAWDQAQQEVAALGKPLLEGRVRRGVTAGYTLVSMQQA